MVDKVNRKLILDKKKIEEQIKKYSDFIDKYKTKINSNEKKLNKINEKLINQDDYIYLEYKDVIKNGIYDSSISFKRYKELYLTVLKRKIKVINSTKKTLLKSDIDIKKKKSIW
tara:strand:+ start:165 stop:506 length:342 start_codon:yes stop_codon:yes gene_type:complete